MKKQQKREFNEYIDEAGDEGINKGSKFFILTAIIVEKEQDLNIAKCVDEIKNNLEIPQKTQLHWNSIKGTPNKNMIVDIISKQEITIINIIIDTKCIQFIPSKNLYFHFSGYLYERICWFAKEHNAVVNINISARGNLTKKAISDYINSKNHIKFNIESKYISQIKIIPNERKRLLQLADCCCSSLFQALKYNNDTHFNYIKKVQTRIYSHKGNILSYGLKLVPTNSKSKELLNLISFLNK